MDKVKNYFDDVGKVLSNLDMSQIESLLVLLEDAYSAGRAVFVIGNGGSGANASHFAQDLSKAALPDFENGKRFNAMSLTDNVSFMTAIANDIGYDRVFDLQLRQFAGEGDVLVAISGSGNSPNILKAAECAQDLKMKIVSVTGFDGGKLMPMADIKIHAACNDMCKSEAVHGVIFHMIVDLLRERLEG